MIKRVFDLVLSIAGLMILAPMMLLIATLVKLDSPGPALFRQLRVGRFGKQFYVYKFRTMVLDAEMAGPKISAANDSRITRLGRCLRDWKLDELPQLFNVLIGQMSIVGPRPEVPEYVSLYSAPARQKVLSVRPGITDEASIKFRNENQLLPESGDPTQYYVLEILPQKIEIYEEYVDNQSLLGDIAIVLRTIKTIMSR